jgi:hypothetical protein
MCGVGEKSWQDAGREEDGLYSNLVAYSEVVLGTGVEFTTGVQISSRSTDKHSIYQANEKKNSYSRHSLCHLNNQETSRDSESEES